MESSSTHTQQHIDNCTAHTKIGDAYLVYLLNVHGFEHNQQLKVYSNCKLVDTLRSCSLVLSFQAIKKVYTKTNALRVKMNTFFVYVSQFRVAFFRQHFYELNHFFPFTKKFQLVWISVFYFFSGRASGTIWNRRRRFYGRCISRE